MTMCKFRQDACDAYCNIAKQHDFCKDEVNCPVFRLQEENERLQKENKISEEIIIGEQQEINELKKKLDFFLTETGKEYN